MKRLSAVSAALAAAVAVTVPAVTAYAAGAPTAARPSASRSVHRSGAAKPSTSAPVRVTPYSPPAAPDAVRPTTPPATIRVSSPFTVRVDRTGKKTLDATWPSASSIFTLAELRQVLPRLTAITPTQCHPGNLPAGGSTHLSTTCNLDLSITGEPGDDRSMLMINIRGFGLPKQIGAQWGKDLAQARTRSAHRPGLYTFYANTSLGASAAFTDGTTTEVLLQHGDVAGEVWFSGIGFTTLTPDYLASRRLYRERIVPALVRLLAAKLNGDPAAG